MSYIAATPEFGLIIRKSALTEKGVNRATLIDLLDEDDDLLSYGSMFGEEVLQDIQSRLSSIGLGYVDDYFELNFLMPAWVRLGVASAS